MIELKLNVSEIDFEAAIRLLAGSGMAGNAAVIAAGALSDSAKEELAVMFLNNSAEKLQSAMESFAEKQGVHVKVSGAQATVIRES